MQKDQTLYLASAVTLALTGVSTEQANAAPRGKCYGVVKAEQNDCKAGPGTSCRGSQTIDYDPRGWVVRSLDDCKAEHYKLKKAGVISHPFKWEPKA